MGIRMSEIIVFRLETCPNCDKIGELAGVSGKTVDKVEYIQKDGMKAVKVWVDDPPVIEVME